MQRLFTNTERIDSSVFVPFRGAYIMQEAPVRLFLNIFWMPARSVHPHVTSFVHPTAWQEVLCEYYHFLPRKPTIWYAMAEINFPCRTSPRSYIGRVDSALLVRIIFILTLSIHGRKPYLHHYILLCVFGSEAMYFKAHKRPIDHWKYSSLERMVLPPDSKPISLAREEG